MGRVWAQGAKGAAIVFVLRGHKSQRRRLPIEVARPESECEARLMNDNAGQADARDKA
jgi:hypothetical protein